MGAATIKFKHHDSHKIVTIPPPSLLDVQLEEMEDKDSSLTSITLNEDGTVTFGETSGPLPKSSSGNWVMVSALCVHI